MGAGFGALGPLAAIASRKSLTSSAVATGKPLTERTTISVLDPSGSENFTAMPRGISSVSGTVGKPDPSEKRTVTGTGVFRFWKCAALLMDAAVGLGVNVPSSTTPLV